MAVRIIDTPNAPQPKIPVAQAVRSGHLVFLSGITPFTLDMQLAEDFASQMHQTMANVGAILTAAGSGFDRVVKCTVILARREDWPAMNDIYASYFPAPAFPARTAFQALLPHPKFLVEVECVAEVDDTMESEGTRRRHEDPAQGFGGVDRRAARRTRRDLDRERRDQGPGLRVLEPLRGQPGTNPEELLGAAHAGCFTMAVSAALGEAGLTAELLQTNAAVTLVRDDGGFSIPAVALHLEARIPGVDDAKFQEIAAKAKTNCPLSKVLRAEITLDAKLV